MATKYFIAPNAWGIFCGMDKTARIDSRTVAEVFEKEHKNVLQTIENIKNDFEKISENGQNQSAENSADYSTDINNMFVQAVYKDSKGRKQKCYNMNREGFSYLVFGFTGIKAAKFRLEYINRFNEMEAFIRDKLAYIEDNRLFTDAIKLYKETHADNVIECKFIYANEQDLANEIVLGMRAKAFKKRYGIPEKETSIRIYCTQEQINAIHRLQGLDAALLFQNMKYADRKAQLNKFADTLGLRIGTDAQEEELKKLEAKSA